MQQRQNRFPQCIFMRSMSPLANENCRRLFCVLTISSVDIYIAPSFTYDRNGIKWKKSVVESCAIEDIDIRRQGEGIDEHKLLKS